MITWNDNNTGAQVIQYQWVNEYIQDWYVMVGLKQSPNFLSMRLVQLVNNIKVSSEKYPQDTSRSCIFRILLKSIFILYHQDAFKKYLAQQSSEYITFFDLEP